MGLFDLLGKKSIKGSDLAKGLHSAVASQTLKLHNSYPTDPDEVTDSGYKRTADSVYFIMLQFGLDSLCRTLHKTHGPGKYDEFIQTVISSLTSEYFEIPKNNANFDKHLQAFIQKIGSISGEYTSCATSISRTESGSPRMNSALGKSAYLVSEVLGLGPWMPGLIDQSFPDDLVATQNPIDMHILMDSYLVVLQSLQLNDLKDASLA